MREPDCEKCIACAVHYMKDYDSLSEALINSPSNRMFLCPTCGNKRCPHASDHRLDCTNSNEPNQPGSEYQQRYFDDE